MESAVEPTAVDTADRAHRPTIVCIDDDPEIIQALTLVLARYDVEVVGGFTGEQGIWETLCRKPDLVITDIRMPRGSGNTVIECLRAIPQTGFIPVIVLTGLRDRHLKGRMKRLGATGYLQKPVTIADLLREIGKYLELRKRATDASGSGSWRDNMPSWNHIPPH